MTNEDILLKSFKKLYALYKKEKFVIDKSGVKVIELIDHHISNLNPKQPYLDFGVRKTNEDYVKKESNWYNSQSLSINGYVDDVKIWKQVADKDGLVNSNYGWCIYSKDNYNQYENCLHELEKNQYSRRACMIYNRPSMQIDYCKNGMSDFICTFSTQQFIRNNKLYYIVNMRSNDSIFGFGNDFAWHCEVYNKLYNDLKKTYPKLKYGKIHWNAGSFHIYERHFDLLKDICETFKSKKG